MIPSRVSGAKFEAKAGDFKNQNAWFFKTPIHFTKRPLSCGGKVPLKMCPVETLEVFCWCLLDSDSRVV